ncbi:hypothetical protein [Viridibacillus arvi]|uniref:hypothetical protein n=1 Tax=Viridibacillus arvi TaxID=263475 RepID=UPI0034D00249
MLKLVSDNTSKNILDEPINNGTSYKTCKKNCVLFNREQNCCPIFKGLNYNEPNVVKRCMEFTDIQETESLYNESDLNKIVDTSMKDNGTAETDSDFLFELIGERTSENERRTNYPVEPEISFDQSMPGLHWYVSPNNTFGCWIKSNYKKTYGVIPTSKENAVKGWTDNIYRSPIPLHDHCASESLKTRMCWFVDEDGWGQYTVIVANQIKFITYPKPPRYGK